MQASLLLLAPRLPLPPVDMPLVLGHLGNITHIPQPARWTLTVLAAVLAAASLAPYDCQVAPILPIFR